MAKKLEVGSSVKVNGTEGRITVVHYGQLKGMYDVMLFDGCQIVGEVCVSNSEIQVVRA